MLAVVALAAYMRTLAPDVLYGDSAVFQTLAYTFGITHLTTSSWIEELFARWTPCIYGTTISRLGGGFSLPASFRKSVQVIPEEI